ncbi:MAG: lysophospholipid acyltransferase family protein [Verrucomicrobiales bacterium]
MWWKKLRWRLEFSGLLVATLFTRALPRRLMIAFANLGGWLWYRLDRRSRVVADQNLALVFADKDESWRRNIAVKSCQNIVRAALELLWAQRLSGGSWKKWVVLEGFEKEFERQGPAILTLTHYGSFEWIGLMLAHAGLEGMALTQPFKNPLIEEYYKKMRTRSGNTVASKQGAMLRMFKQLKRGGRVGLLVDLTLHPNQPSVVLDSFGRWQNMTMLHALLHQRSGAPILILESEPLPDGRVLIRALEPIESSEGLSLEDIARQCWAAYQKRILARPDLWLWAYKHWRYLDPSAPEKYPDYAHVSPKFTKKIQAMKDAQAQT